jgi:hypothetical protein
VLMRRRFESAVKRRRRHENIVLGFESEVNVNGR